MIKKRDKILWNIKDFLSSTRVELMSLEEEGAYRRALDKFYLNGYLPYDLEKLAKVIGKGCTVEIAKVVRDMFKESSNHPNTLTHDYLEKLIDGDDKEMVISLTSNKTTRDAFIKYVESLTKDEMMLALAMQRHGLTPSDVLEIARDFAMQKLAMNKFSEYSSTNDIRRNFIYFMPYSKQAKNKSNANTEVPLNPKSVTSKLQSW